jgi:hypothetical protein
MLNGIGSMRAWGNGCNREMQAVDGVGCSSRNWLKLCLGEGCGKRRLKYCEVHVYKFMLRRGKV